MRNVIILVLLILIALPEAMSQNRERRGPDPHRKINQLEKVKLMEVLNLDDETAVKFFNMKDQHQTKMRGLRDESDEILDNIEETLSSEESKKSSSLTKMLERFKALELEMTSGRVSFLKEAELILSPEKYARYLVFERNFRAEIRELIMGDRKRRGNP
jgi:hypothetical protein